MIALIQRALSASVVVEGNIVGEIGPGLLVLLGVEQGDTEQKHSVYVSGYWGIGFLAMRMTK